MGRAVSLLCQCLEHRRPFGSRVRLIAWMTGLYTLSYAPLVYFLFGTGPFASLPTRGLWIVYTPLLQAMRWRPIQILFTPWLRLWSVEVSVLSTAERGLLLPDFTMGLGIGVTLTLLVVAWPSIWARRGPDELPTP
jgi:hypothetical protein